MTDVRDYSSLDLPPLPDDCTCGGRVREDDVRAAILAGYGPTGDVRFTLWRNHRGVCPCSDEMLAFWVGDPCPACAGSGEAETGQWVTA